MDWPAYILFGIAFAVVVYWQFINPNRSKKKGDAPGMSESEAAAEREAEKEAQPWTVGSAPTMNFQVGESVKITGSKKKGDAPGVSESKGAAEREGEKELQPRTVGSAATTKFQVGQSVKITGLRNPLFATREGQTGRMTSPIGPFGHVVKKYGAIGTVVEIDRTNAIYKVRFLSPADFSATGEGSGDDFVNLWLELDDRCLAPL